MRSFLGFDGFSFSFSLLAAAAELELLAASTLGGSAAMLRSGCSSLYFGCSVRWSSPTSAALVARMRFLSPFFLLLDVSSKF